MKGSYADKVIENVHFLSHNTRSLYHIMRTLAEKGILTTRETRSIMLLPDSYTKSYDLYQNLADKGEDACRALLEIWTDTGNEELTKKVITTSDVSEEKPTQGNIFQLIGEEGELKIFRALPPDIQSISKLITEIDLCWVEVDAFTFPKSLEKCSNVQKLTLNKVKITGIFPPRKISLESLKEFHVNLVGGRINYYNYDATESVRFLVFFDTTKSIMKENNWELNGGNIWQQNCDIIVADNGKVLLASFPRRKSLTASMVDVHSILKDAHHGLEKLALSRVKLHLKNYPKQYYNISESLTELILHNVDTENIAVVVLSSKNLKTLKIIAKSYPTIDTGHLPPGLNNLSLGFVNLTHSQNISLSMDTIAFDFCTISQNITKNFHEIFSCKNLFIGGEGYLFQPSLSFLTKLLKRDQRLQWLCLSGFNYDFNNCTNSDIIDELELSNLTDIIPNGTHHFTMEVVNDCWKGESCSLDQIILTKYDLFGWDSFWEKEMFFSTQTHLRDLELSTY